MARKKVRQARRAKRPKKTRKSRKAAKKTGGLLKRLQLTHLQPALRVFTVLVVIFVWAHGAPLEAQKELHPAPAKLPAVTTPKAPEEGAPYQIEIPKIHVSAPMVWSQSDDENALLSDLEHGIARYPDTGLPGQSGNLVLAGHSSYYPWAAGDYKFVLKDEGKLSIGDTILVRELQAGDGGAKTYTYKITEKRIVSATNPWIFEQPADKSTLTLASCWPVGTTLARLVVRAELVTE